MKSSPLQTKARSVYASILAVVLPVIQAGAQSNWRMQESHTTENLVAVAFGQNVFVAVGDNGKLLRSADNGQTWQDRSNSEITVGGLHCVAFGNGVFMAGAGDEVVVSTDVGLTWHRAASTAEWLSGLAYGNGRWFAAANSISVSVNQGDTWSLVDANKRDLASILFNGNVGVAVGGTIVVSQDGGLTWEDVAKGLFNWQTSVAYGNGRYVSVGGVFGNVITQTADPLTWAEAGSTNLSAYESLLSVAYGGNTFVVVGDQGVILKSNGTQPWTPAVSGTSEMLRGVAFGNGTFVAVGQNGTILTAGQAPEINSSLTASGFVGTAFSYGITALYGAAEFGADDLPPGLTVNPDTGIISGTPSEAGQFSCTITAANSYGTDTETLIITISSGSGTEFQIRIHTAVELEIKTRVGHTYQIECSSNLTSWSNYGSAFPGDGQTQYRLCSTRDPNQRFYRVREQ